MMNLCIKRMSLALALMVLSALPAPAAWVPAVWAAAGGNAAQDLGEVVVVGEKIDAFIRENPSQVVTMGAAEIETRNFLQVSDVLGAMPGVEVTPSGTGIGTRISIRGGGGSGSVLVLIDGRPAATMQFGGVDLSSIPIDMIQKITVFKPPVPVWLGPDSAAGAIFIETRPKKAKSKAGTSGKVRVSAGAYGLAAASATSRVDTKDAQVTVSGGLSHRDGKRENSQQDQGRLNIGYDRKKGGREFQVNAKAFISDHGVAGPTYNPTPHATQRYEKASLDMKTKGFADTLDYTLKAWADVKRLDETSETGADSTLDTFTSGFGTDLFLPVGERENELRVGALAEHNRVDHTLTGKHDRTRLSAHTEYNIRTRPIVYSLGGRAEYTNDFSFSPAGHAGLSWNLARMTRLKANLGYSEHIPSFSQLYQPSHGAIDQVRGNPDLKEEQIVSASLGVEQSLAGGHRCEVSLFRTDSRDLIKYQRGDDNISVPENVDRAYKQGIETVFKFKISDKTGIDVNYILQETENQDNGKALSYAPTHTVKLIFKTQFPAGTRLEWTTRGYSKQYSDTENTESETISPYLATDVKLSQPLTLFRKKALAFAEIHNLFDKDYASHYGYPDDGIKLTLGLSVDF